MPTFRLPIRLADSFGPSQDSSRPIRVLLVNTTMAVCALLFGLLSDQNVVYRGHHHHPLALQIADLVAGVVCVAGIWLWRRRSPIGFALFSIAVGIFSTLAGGVGLVAVFTVAVHRRWQASIAISVLAAASIFPTLWLYPLPHDARTEIGGVVMTFAVTGWGMFVRARRQLLASLRMQLRQADQVADERAEAARRGESERIAREMHDVLAHRLSLLAVHAGALEFRRDASPEDVNRAAGVIRANTHEALNELRSVITLLRDTDAESVRPQPTLRDLPALVEESRRAGLNVFLRWSGDTADHAHELPAVAGRTVYRVVQEALTNARKYAGAAQVQVELDGCRGTGFEASVLNDLPSVVERGNGQRRDGGLQLPGSGTGLIGLDERVTLAGGRLDYGPTRDQQFQVHAWLPWPPIDAAGPKESLATSPETAVRVTAR